VRLAVVIPAHNEAARLPQVLSRLSRTSLPVELMAAIVVDDGSSDGTAEAAVAAGARVIRSPANRGKGASLLDGCDEALRLGADVVAVMDADGQHRPEDLGALLAPVVSGDADVVLGSRPFTREMPPLYRMGNRLLSAVFGICYGLPVGDTQCGLRLLSAQALRALRWASPGYAVESEMLVRLARTSLRWTERPIPALYHDRRKGTQPRDGLVILGKLLAWRFGGLPEPPPPQAVPSTLRGA
jgi:glycosyltransferase involved in cell wall biosynthesis